MPGKGIPGRENSERKAQGLDHQVSIHWSWGAGGGMGGQTLPAMEAMEGLEAHVIVNTFFQGGSSHRQGGSGRDGEY